MKLLNSNYNIYLLGVICIILLVISSLTLEFVSYSKSFDEELFIQKNNVIIEDNYKINISYPHFKNKDINKGITNMIDSEKKIFKNNVYNSNAYENELHINYNYLKIGSLYSFNIRSYSYIGKDNDYHRNDKIIYFDEEINKEIDKEDLILDKRFYEVVRNYSYDYLISKKDIYNIKDIKKVNRALIADSSNYNLISFDKEYVVIKLQPYSVSDYVNEILINVPYSKVIRYLNSKYFYDMRDDEIDTATVIKSYDRIRDSKDFEGKKLVALTFDDGPSYAKTEKLLNELDKRNARVSFFMLGELANKQKDLVRRAYNYGHTIGSHSYDHKNLKKLNSEELMIDIDNTNKILSDIIGEDIKFLRPPYGAYNEKVLKEINMSFILWNVDTLDWKYRNAERVSEYIIKHAKDGDIILLHDIHATSVEGAIMAIDELKKLGFEFVSIEEMMVFRNINLYNHKAYRSLK